MPKARAFKTFEITKVFSICNTHCVQKAWIKDFNGDVPYVTASSANNSVDSFISYDSSMIDKGNALVIGGKTFVVTYQERDFYSNDSHNLILRLKDEASASRRVYLYLAAVVIRALGSKYSWGDSVSYKKIQSDRICIPVDSEGKIDFAYMESYIEKIEAARLKLLRKFLKDAGLEDYRLTKEESRAIQDFKNGKVRLEEKRAREIFVIVKGKRLTKESMKKGSLRFVSATSANNGITAWISNEKYVQPKGTISVSYNGSVGEAFYQDEEYWASDDINVFKPKFAMSCASALFFCAVLRKLGKRYAYNFKWAKEIMEDELLLYPVQKDGAMDLNFMSVFIRAIMKRALKNLEAWQSSD